MSHEENLKLLAELMQTGLSKVEALKALVKIRLEECRGLSLFLHEKPKTARELSDIALREAALKNLAERKRIPELPVELSIPIDTAEDLKQALTKSGFILRQEIE